MPFPPPARPSHGVGSTVAETTFSHSGEAKASLSDSTYRRVIEGKRPPTAWLGTAKRSNERARLFVECVLYEH